MTGMKAAGAVTLGEVTYGYSYNRPVIEGVNLSIAAGSFVGILGPSGSGKTTLLKVIAGLVKPWHGSVDLERGRKIGYVPQVESVDWNFPVTVKEVVSMGVWNSSGRGPWIGSAAGEAIMRVLESLGIGDYASRQISELSGGEQQRVFLARAMIRSPDVLVLDEPTSGVDHATREAILGVLGELNQKGVTVILTTHDISGVARRLPWVVCMNRRIISQGRPADILTNENLLATYGLVVDTEGGR
ncbi:ABC uptake transporter, ATP-binding protein [Nitrososphaera viennensis EN76]|uniref:ABC uptake transporter, ATP-binding protein n=2 Tax=Nitrososphaera viennensis TaxID=1034015 RepID=A0A060HQB4_9ARCH|nr:ABC uptake transporter, ATP-binding protein [Nitrososphaera viennensis EN76]